MTTLATIRTELEKFGLSKNQAEIYLLLVNHGELRIQEIVGLSKIPRSSVYESLAKLYELGIAEEIIDNSFKKIRPYSIGTIRHGLDEEIIKLQRLTSDLDSLEKAIPLNNSHTNPHSIKVRYYKNRSGARQLYWNTLKAKNTVHVYSDWGRGRYVGMKFYKNFVAESAKRNIKENVMTNTDPKTWESIKRFNYPPSSQIVRTKIEDLRFLDKEIYEIKGDTFIYDNVYAQIYLKNIEINGFEIESQQFADSQRSLYKILWQMAKPLPPTLSEAEKAGIVFEGVDDPHVGKLPISR